MQLLAIYTTVSDADTANGLAQRAVELGLAACVQVEPVRSTYRLQGRIESEDEWRLLFKTTAYRQPALQHWLSQVHPYQLPAIYAVPVTQASPNYAAWVAEAVELSPPDAHDALSELQRLETEFHHPGAPCSPERLDALLHPDFFEIGRSGQRYGRAAVIGYLSQQQAPASVVSWGFAARPLGTDHALLTYQSARQNPSGERDRLTHRSSVWVRTANGWQIIYHQGTPAD